MSFSSLPWLFVRDALSKVKNRVEDARRSTRLAVLREYDNKDTFIGLLEEQKREALDGFFGSDSESEDEYE